MTEQAISHVTNERPSMVGAGIAGSSSPSWARLPERDAGFETALDRNRAFAAAGGQAVAVSGHVYDLTTGLVETVAPAANRSR